MEKIVAGIVLKAEERGEANKLVTLLTVEGVITAMMKGVKKEKAKLKFGALPFVFAEYALSGKEDFYTVTGCAQIDDLSAVTYDLGAYYAASFMSEVAINAKMGESVFFDFLRTLKSIVYDGIDPVAAAIHFCQCTIHCAGYGYDYAQEPSCVNRPIDLLHYTYSIDRLKSYSFDDKELLYRTLGAIAKNFEEKFDCTLVSKTFLR